MRWLGGRAEVAPSLRAEDERGRAWQLASRSCRCFARWTRVVFNQPADVQKLCLLFGAPELMGKGGCSHRFTERWAVKVTACLPTTTSSLERSWQLWHPVPRLPPKP